MKKIFKYPLKVEGEQKITMPEKAKILSFQFQDDTPCIWAMVDPTAKVEARTFYILGTGHEVPPLFFFNYIGTAQHNGFVWHLFSDGIS